MSATISINGVTLATGAVVPIAVTTFARGDIPSFRFFQRGGPLSGFSNYDNKTVTLTQGATLIFSGDTTSHVDRFDSTFGWVREWNAMGLANRALRVPVTDSNTLTDTAAYNLRPEDGASYLASRAGRTVGQIVADVLTMLVNAAALDGKGIGNYTGMPGAPTLPAATLADLAAMTIIPPQRVYVSGERILQAIEGAVQQFYPNHFLHVEPGGDIRFLDPRSWPADVTLELDGSDPRVPKPTFTRDWNTCYQRVVIRGDTQVKGVTFSLVPWAGSTATDGGATEDFGHDGLTNAQAKAAFTAADWNEPGQSNGQATATATIGSGAVTAISVGNQGYSYASAPSISITGGGGTGATATANLTSGKVTSITVNTGGSGYTTAPTVTLTSPAVGQSVVGSCVMSTTVTLVITPSDAKVQWPANYWDQTATGHQGNVVLLSDTIPGITSRHAARIVANTALSPGGTCTLTIDIPTPDLSFTGFQIFGTGGGAGVVYRRYAIVAPYGAAIQQMFPYEVPYRMGDTLAMTLVSTPQASVFYSTSGNPPYQTSAVGIAAIDPDAGTVTLAKPSALVFSPNGTTLVPVNDVQFFLPIATGGLEVVYPADVAGVPQYAGTSHTAEGLEETKYVACREWRDGSNTAVMQAWAQELHGAMSDTIIEGEVSYLGLLASVLLPGHAVNLPGNGYTTGWESVDLPIQRVTLEYQSGRSPVSYTTSLSLSNRRVPFNGEALLRPGQTGLSVGLPEGAAGFGGGSDNAMAYAMAGEAMAAGPNFQLGTGNQTSLGDSGFTMNDIAAAGRDTGGGIRDAATNPNRRIAARNDSDVGNTSLRSPKNEAERERIANLGNNAAGVDSRIANLGASRPKAVDPAEEARIANLGVNAAGTSDQIKNLGAPKPKTTDPAEEARIANLGNNAAGTTDRIKNLGVNKKPADPDEEERIRKLGLGED